MNFRDYILETSHADFLKEFRPLFNKSVQIQRSFPKEYEGDDTFDPENDYFRRSWQVIPQDKQKSILFQKQQSLQPQYIIGNASQRRASFLQTAEEVEVDKELLRLFAKYADQSAFDDLIFYHNFDFKDFGEGEIMMNKNEQIEYYFRNENKNLKNVISCKATSAENNSYLDGFGMMLKGYVVFASRSDVNSQITKRASQEVLDFYKHSGIPKRTGPENVAKFASASDSKMYEPVKKLLSKRSGRDPTEEELENYFNHVILNKKDMGSYGINGGEFLLANARVQGWYFCNMENGKPYPIEIWDKAHKADIKKPVYYFDPLGDRKIREVDFHSMMIT